LAPLDPPCLQATLNCHVANIFTDAIFEADRRGIDLAESMIMLSAMMQYGLRDPHRKQPAGSKQETLETHTAPSAAAPRSLSWVPSGTLHSPSFFPEGARFPNPPLTRPMSRNALPSISFRLLPSVSAYRIFSPFEYASGNADSNGRGQFWMQQGLRHLAALVEVVPNGLWDELWQAN
jgi:hypothetical protein